MDIVNVIETLGIPIAVALVLGYGCLYLMKFITSKLIKRLDEQFQRLEQIIIKLIDVQKEMTITVGLSNKQTNTHMTTMIDIVTKLLKNGNSNSCSNYRRRNK